jgi:hypothetical protein
MQYYCTVRPEEFAVCVKKTRPPKIRKRTMPLPKKVAPTNLSSSIALAAHDAEENANLFKALILDFESTLQQLGKAGIITLKVGYKTGFQLSLGVNKEYSNVSRSTVLECLEAYLMGDFD